SMSVARNGGGRRHSSATVSGAPLQATISASPSVRDHACATAGRSGDSGYSRTWTLASSTALISLTRAPASRNARSIGSYEFGSLASAAVCSNSLLPGVAAGLVDVGLSKTGQSEAGLSE